MKPAQIDIFYVYVCGFRCSEDRLLFLLPSRNNGNSDLQLLRGRLRFVEVLLAWGSGKGTSAVRHFLKMFVDLHNPYYLTGGGNFLVVDAAQ